MHELEMVACIAFDSDENGRTSRCTGDIHSDGFLSNQSKFNRYQGLFCGTQGKYLNALHLITRWTASLTTRSPIFMALSTPYRSVGGGTTFEVVPNFPNICGTTFEGCAIYSRIIVRPKGIHAKLCQNNKNYGITLKNHHSKSKRISSKLCQDFESCVTILEELTAGCANERKLWHHLDGFWHNFEVVPQIFEVLGATFEGCATNVREIRHNFEGCATPNATIGCR
ncbi:hypothetical protein BJ165DRAFT_1407292 [Panaeolus papilionaceus]|nr:hypothetical protein BJ165DRAFT_1407292 [Panaeolus papilionaceus]